MNETYRLKKGKWLRLTFDLEPGDYFTITDCGVLIYKDVVEWKKDTDLKLRKKMKAVVLTRIKMTCGYCKYSLDPNAERPCPKATKRIFMLGKVIGCNKGEPHG